MSPDRTFGPPELDEELFANGVDGARGTYAWPALTPRQIALAAMDAPRRSDWTEELRLRHLRRSREVRTLTDGADAACLEEAGWGVIFPQDAPPERVEALRPLIERRRAASSALREGRFRCFNGESGFRAGESKTAFLRRHGVGPGPVDPDRMPYYLLLAGDPAEIPFEFQRQLDVGYGVGRVAFASPAGYRAYAEKVARTEDQAPVAQPEAVFFGARHHGDRATSRSAELLVGPLAEASGEPTLGWRVRRIIGEQAVKASLSRIVNGSEPAHFLMTAGHGMVFPHGHPRSHDDLGALLCSDWRGVGDTLDESCYFAGRDLEPAPAEGALITLHFACYSGGTPARDSFPHRASPLAQPPRPWLAHLPQALLAAPEGGAVAAIVHIDRAWTTSFLWPGAGPQIQLFRHTVRRILKGHRLGLALEGISETYAEVVSDLERELDEATLDDPASLLEIALLWTTASDLGGFLLLGDPAVRAPVTPVP